MREWAFDLAPPEVNGKIPMDGPKKQSKKENKPCLNGSGMIPEPAIYNAVAMQTEEARRQWGESNRGYLLHSLVSRAT